MEKEWEMIHKVIPKLGKGYKVRKDPHKSSSIKLLSFPSKRGVPPLHECMANVRNQSLRGPHTLGDPLGA
jgi:hypothetical protein